MSKEGEGGSPPTPAQSHPDDVSVKDCHYFRSTFLSDARAWARKSTPEDVAAGGGGGGVCPDALAVTPPDNGVGFRDGIDATAGLLPAEDHTAPAAGMDGATAGAAEVAEVVVVVAFVVVVEVTPVLDTSGVVVMWDGSGVEGAGGVGAEGVADWATAVGDGGAGDAATAEAHSSTGGTFVAAAASMTG